MQFAVEDIARIAHELNRLVCQRMGDWSHPFWVMAPGWQKQSAIDGVKFHLRAHRDGFTPTPEESHENWLKQKIADGWTYGPLKDVDAKTHPCLLPYEELPAEQRLKDHLFRAVVAAFVRCYGKELLERIDE